MFTENSFSSTPLGFQNTFSSSLQFVYNVLSKLSLSLTLSQEISLLTAFWGNDSVHSSITSSTVETLQSSYLSCIWWYTATLWQYLLGDCGRSLRNNHAYFHEHVTWLWHL